MLLEIAAPTIEWGLLAPLLILLGAGSIGVLVEAFVPREYRYTVQVPLALLSVLGALMVVVRNWAAGSFQVGAMGSVSIDGPSQTFWLILLVAGLLGLFLFAERTLTGGSSAFTPSAATVPGSTTEREAEAAGLEHTEVYPLLMFALFGMLLFAAANDTITMFVGLEVFSLPLYLMAGLARRRRLLSQEAALKYFLLGALSSAIFVYGVALLYGYSGDFELSSLDAAIAAGASSDTLLLAGMALVAVGLLFKMAVAPFHMWAPDVYQGSPTALTGFMSVATKTATVAALARLFFVGLGGMRWDWQPLFSVLAVTSMAVGAVIAISQTDIKRLLAYSSVAHAGFVLVGLIGAVTLANTPEGPASVSSVAFYLSAYLCAALGAFGMVTMVRRSGGEANALDAWTGLGRKHPVFGAVMALFMLSFAGIPLTAGFVGKFLVFAAAWRGDHPWLVLVAVLMSLIASYFYLRVIAIMFFRRPDAATAEVCRPGPFTLVVVGVGAAGSLVFGLIPGPLLALVGHATVFLG